MRLYLLELNKDLRVWDCNLGHVIRTTSEKNARIMAAGVSADEDRDWHDGSDTIPDSVWLDPNCTTCTELNECNTTYASGIILTSFNPG